MPETVIDCQNIKKRYRLGQTASPDTLRDAVTGVFKRKTPNPAADDSATDSGRAFWALRGVSFQVQRGECLGIIGHNGAGKSTLLKVLSRITEPTAGRIEMLGRVAALLEVGTGFHPELTGLENTYLNGSILGMTRKEVRAKLADIVEFAGTEKFMNTPVKRYSSGMRVRLGFAVAAHLDPEILIVDEVLAVGDVQFQKRCIGRMERTASEGRTVLFVSHNMDMINNLCTRCLLLHQGGVRFTGATEQVVQRYVEQQQGLVTDDAGGPLAHASFFTAVSVDDQDAPCVCLARPSQTLRLRISGDTGQTRRTGLLLGIQLYSRQGSHIATYSTAWGGLDDLDIEGAFTVEVELHLPELLPGEYYCDIDAYANRRLVESIPSVVSISVLPSDAFSESVLLPTQGMHGFLHAHASWTRVD